MLPKVKISALIGLMLAATVAILLAPMKPPPLYTARPVAAVDLEPKRQTVALFIGDSYTAGSAGVPSDQTYAPLTCYSLGWVCNIDAQGGTGYVNDGHANNTKNSDYAGRLSSTAANYLADIVIISGGRNDTGLATSARPAVQNYVKAVRSAYPKAALVVLTPFWIDGDSPSAIAPIRNAVIAAARLNGATLVDTDGWINESMVGPDHVHPTVAGHQRLAAEVVAALHHVKLPVIVPADPLS